MAKRRKKKKRISEINFLLLLIMIFLMYVLYIEVLHGTYAMPIFNDIYPNDTTKTTVTNNNINNDDKLKIYFLDVGQADSILIQSNGENMLIDAGNNEDGKLLVNYFNELNISSFKYVVGTHPHEDHIGGLDDVINSFTIDKVLLPDAITTTRTFTDVLDAIENKNMKFNVPKIGEVFSLGNSKLEVIYTGHDESDLNNTSIVLRLDYYNNSFLFTGDATSKVEKLIIDKNIDVDVLKVGHHGSNYSTTKKFLDKVNPKYAIISVGANNSYRHPADTTLDKLENKMVMVYRTDELGTVLCTSDGNSIEFTNFRTNTNGG